MAQREVSIDRAQRLLDECRVLQNQTAEELRSRFLQLADDWRSVAQQIREADRRVTPEYNIFEVLSIEHLEVTTHSAFLVDLLNPRGSHCQGDLFLKEFLQNTLQLHPTARDARWHVRPEKSTNVGRFDIFIAAIDAPNRIIIENKIGSGDQDGQLLRYYRWLKDHYDLASSTLLYLTINGDEPGNTAFTGEAGLAVEARNYVRRISYRHDILEWLQRCIPRVESSRVRDVVQQYLGVIHNLGGEQ